MQTLTGFSIFSFSPSVLKLLLHVYAFIATCSAIGFIHPKLRRPESRSIRQAINSWWPPALVGGVAVLLGRVAAVPIFLVVSVWALREFLHMLPESDRPRDTVVLAYAAVPLHYAAMATGHAELSHGVVLAFWSFAVIPLVRAMRHGPEGLLTGVGRVVLGLLLTVFALGHVARLFLLPPHIGPSGPEGLACLLLLCVMANDASQYVVGKLAGRHRLAPVLSPKKTWEGLAGGVLITMLVAAAATPLLAPFGRATGALVGAALALLGILGDLLISALKRDAGVKDTGTVLPGQGGVLDRMDSMLLSAPIYYHVIKEWLA